MCRPCCSLHGLWEQGRGSRVYQQGGRGNAASSAFSHVLGCRGLILGLGMCAPFSNWAFFFSFSIWRGFLVVTKEGGKVACV